jgi:hypothetical protein
MYFLIEFNPKNGKKITYKQFADSELEMVNKARLELEIATATKKTNYEIAVFQAPNEAQLKKTHARYFYN